MKAALKYIISTHLRITVLSTLSIAVLAVITNYIFPNGYFATYFTGFPFMTILILFIFSMTLSMTYTNTALSMGAKRKDMYVVLHVSILLAMAFSLLMSWVLYYIHFFPPFIEIDTPYLFTPDTALMWSVFMLIAQMLGLPFGALTVGHRALGIVLTSIATMILMGCVTLFMIIAVLEIPPWGNLNQILIATLILCAGGGEIYFWRYMKTAVVR